MNRATASSVLSSEFGQPSDFGQPPDAFFNSARAARILRSAHDSVANRPTNPTRKAAQAPKPQSGVSQAELIPVELRHGGLGFFCAHVILLTRPTGRMAVAGGDSRRELCRRAVLACFSPFRGEPDKYQFAVHVNISNVASTNGIPIRIYLPAVSLTAQIVHASILDTRLSLFSAEGIVDPLETLLECEQLCRHLPRGHYLVELRSIRLNTQVVTPQFRIISAGALAGCCRVAACVEGAAGLWALSE